MSTLLHKQHIGDAGVQKALKLVVEKLVDKYNPERVYLFGSWARGDAEPHSDLDLMVVMPDDAPPEKMRSKDAYLALRGTGIAADILIWPKSYFDRRSHLITSLSGTILREGKLLYAQRP